MSWLFSQALVAEYSAATCSDGAPSAPLNVMPTQHKFWRNDKTMEPCQLSRFGLTCAVLTEDLGGDLLTWYLADSRVRTFPLLEKVPELKAHALGYGHTWPESSARYDLDSCSWKTHRCLFSEDLPWSSVTLPRWGTMLNGYVYQHPSAERPISVTDFGLWPTPTTQSNVQIRGAGAAANHKHRGTTLAGEVVLRGEKHGRLNPNWVEWLMGWPLGWTDLKPLEMDKFQEWRRQHLA